MHIPTIETILASMGEKSFRVKQIRTAVFDQLVSGWDEMSALPAALRLHLQESVPFSTVEHITTVHAEKGDTIKSAFRLHDGNLVEAVIMRHGDGRNTACISSQAGCAMKCSFCATGMMGLKRNLSAEEIVDQTLHLARVLRAEGERLSNVVYMGMGEPMHNLDAVLEASHIMNADWGLGIGARHISVSTCGIVPGILKLAEQPLQLNLAVSLHAPNNDLRSRMMPINRAYPLEKLMPAIETYIAKTNRKVMFEYLLIDGFNDSLEVADELAELMRHPLYHVNLIKYHTTGAFVSSSRNQRMRFMERLRERGVSVTHRITFGEDIDAACGQLANTHSRS